MRGRRSVRARGQWGPCPSPCRRSVAARWTLRSCWRRWPASRTARSGGCAASRGAGLYVSRDDHLARAGRAQRRDDAPDPLRRRRDAPVGAAVRRRPGHVAAAVRMVVTEDRADHIDLNFGCPVPKVTRKGGGAALPWKRDLFRDIVRGAVAAADGRRPGHGQDAQGHRRRPPDLPRGRPGGRRGGRGVGRAARAHRGADLRRAGRLVGHRAPRRRARATGRAGAGQRRHLGGRGRAADGRADRLRRRRRRARLPGSAVAVRRSSRRRSPGAPSPPSRAPARCSSCCAGTPSCSSRCTATSTSGCRDIRKHMAWYLKGLRVAQPIRAALGTVGSLAELDDLLAGIDPEQPYPVARRGRPAGAHVRPAAGGPARRMAGLVRAGLRGGPGRG